MTWRFLWKKGAQSHIFPGRKGWGPFFGSSASNNNGQWSETGLGRTLKDAFGNQFLYWCEIKNRSNLLHAAFSLVLDHVYWRSWMGRSIRPIQRPTRGNSTGEYWNFFPHCDILTKELFEITTYATSSFGQNCLNHSIPPRTPLCHHWKRGHKYRRSTRRIPSSCLKV